MKIAKNWSVVYRMNWAAFVFGVETMWDAPWKMVNIYIGPIHILFSEIKSTRPIQEYINDVKRVIRERQ